MVIYQRNYNRLYNLVGGIDRHYRLFSAGDHYMRLTFEWIDDTPEGDPLYSMAHWFEQAGDLIPDPGMILRVYRDQKMVEAISIQHAFLQPRRVYSDDFKLVNIREKQEQNRFLERWLINIKSQGFKLVHTDLHDEEEQDEKISNI